MTALNPGQNTLQHDRPPLYESKGGFEFLTQNTVAVFVQGKLHPNDSGFLKMKAPLSPDNLAPFENNVLQANAQHDIVAGIRFPHDYRKAVDPYTSEERTSGQTTLYLPPRVLVSQNRYRLKDGSTRTFCSLEMCAAPLENHRGEQNVRGVAQANVLFFLPPETTHIVIEMINKSIMSPAAIYKAYRHYMGLSETPNHYNSHQFLRVSDTDKFEPGIEVIPPELQEAILQLDLLRKTMSEQLDPNKLLLPIDDLKMPSEEQSAITTLRARLKTVKNPFLREALVDTYRVFCLMLKDQASFKNLDQQARELLGRKILPIANVMQSGLNMLPATYRYNNSDQTSASLLLAIFLTQNPALKPFFKGSPPLSNPATTIQEAAVVFDHFIVKGNHQVFKK